MRLLKKLCSGIIFVTQVVPLICGTLSAEPNRKSKTNNDKQLIIVGTVDGKLAALDLRHSGKPLWAINLSDGPLISSSITNLVYEEEGKTVRLIPSLHGGLFKFDGDTVEAVPFNADTLLKSSFRLAENTVLVGGKETHFTGIDIQSGKVLYTCNVKGCDQQQSVPDTTDIIVVKRFQQTVRSIENRNGGENWNFSVGEIELQYVKGSETRLLQAYGEKEKANANPEEFYFEQQENIEDFIDISDLSRIKFVVPDGTVCVVNPKNKQIVLWKHTFSAAISSAWVVLNNRLQKLDMFDASKIPALGKDDNAAPSSDVIYMGTFDKQIYVQASPSVQNAVSQAVGHSNVQNPRHASFSPPRFTQKPCNSKSKFLSLSGPDAVSKSGKQTALVAVDNGKFDNKLDKHLMFCPDNTHKKGYYFQGDLSYYSRLQQSGRKGRNTITSDSNDSQLESPMGYLDSLAFYFDKYVVLFFTLVILGVTSILIVYLPSWFDKRSSSPSSKSSDQYDTANMESIAAIAPAREYESRFLQDFEPQECLGKGGFGIVFKARNKMDSCSYAVKRILLPHNKSAREKVLREVRALAQLDHPSIVRYFNAWSEQPPVGWQKKQDDKLANDLSLWSSATQHTEFNKHSTSANQSNLESSKHSETCTNSFQVVDDDPNGFFGPGYSQGFSFHDQNATGNHQYFGGGQSSQISASWAETSKEDTPVMLDTMKGKFFQRDNSDSDSSGDYPENASIPFKHYQNEDDSMSIVFGDHTEKTKESRIQSSEVSSRTCSPISNELSRASPGSMCRKPDVAVKVESSKTEESNQQHNDSVYLYIQMQLCKKESLKEWLVANVQRERKIYSQIFKQVVNAVKYVHERGLIHRDLKPSNVLFSLDGTIKVGDFGLVTHAGEISPEQFTVFDDEANKQHTRHAGTTLYMAPEQMSSRLYTEKVDIFALGLILFELVYSFDTQMEKVRHFTDARQLKFPKNFRTRFPQEAELIFAMLQKHPESRPTAQEINNNVMLDLNH